ncbi:MAG TPA: hypothetical protein VIE89_26385 [Candidatus Binatia bacterium]
MALRQEVLKRSKSLRAVAVLENFCVALSLVRIFMRLVRERGI